MRVRFPIVCVIWIAGFACAGGPTSDFPFSTPSGGVVDAGASGRDPADKEDDESLDAGLPTSGAGAQDAQAAVPASEQCPGDAAADAAVDSGGDAAVDAAADAGADAANADAEAGDAGDAQIVVDANFSDSGDAAGGPADAASDAPYTSADAGPCIP